MILVVDDEKLDTEFMRRVLEGAAFDVLTAEDYATGVETFRTRKDEIGMALLDVSLATRNGVELAKELLTLKPDLKVLFVSGHVGAEVIRFYGLAASDRHFLRKPFREAELLARVREILKSDDPLQWLSPKADANNSKAANGN